MRTAIMGSHGTGKTTLLNELSKGYDGKIINEVARDIIHTMGILPQDMNHEQKVQFQMQVYAKQHALEKGEMDFISDRGVDNLAYAYFVDKDLFRTLLNDYKKNAQGYDNNIYIPVEFGLEKDGVRFEDANFQKQVDKKIQELFGMLGIDPIEVKGGIDYRVSQVKPLLYNK